MITYIDCGAGVAGDMLLGALVGLGLKVKELQDLLSSTIPLKGWSVRVKSVEKRMWPAWSLKVHRDRPFTSPLAMAQIISGSRLPLVVKASAQAILTGLRMAEAKAHGHDHQRFDPKGLGRIDTLVDVIGNAWGFWRLGIQDVVASSVNTGRIAPATRALLTRYHVPVFSDSSTQELATPTGVAILTQLTQVFKPLGGLYVQKAGYGAGTLERPHQPNVLAIYQGTTTNKLLKYSPLKCLR